MIIRILVKPPKCSFPDPEILDPFDVVSENWEIFGGMVLILRIQYLSHEICAPKRSFLAKDHHVCVLNCRVSKSLLFSNTGSNILTQHEGAYSILHSVRQHAFSKHECHYLNVSRVGTFAVYDFFDCTFGCLSNPLCFSVNLAASKGANGKHLCELLSSDKYRNFTEYKGNKTFHHFAIKVESFPRSY